MAAKQFDVSGLIAALFERLPLPAVVTRAEDATVVYANAAARHEFKDEFGVDDMIGKSVLDIGYYPSTEYRDTVLAEARETGGYVRRQNYEVDGVKGAELTSTHLLEYDGEEYLAAVIIDIAEVVEAENALEDALERLTRAQAIAGTGDFMTDLIADEFNCSGVAMRILGFDKSTVSVKELFSHFHPEDKRLVATLMNEQLPHGAFTVEHRLNPEIVGERWVFTQGTVETTAEGRSIVRGTVHDITERKLEEQEREKLKEKMLEAQKLESLGVLAGGIAHDFNNLLTGILGNADFALLESSASPEVRKRLDAIVAASKRAADLTKQLLAYSGKGKFVVEATDLSELVREMADLLNVSISRQHVLKFLLAEELPTVEVDLTQIRQLIMNLIINAAEAIEENHGTISISTGRQSCDAAYLAQSDLSSELTPGEYVYFEVSDDGVGMDADTVQRIFDPFFTTKFTGRGLGLAAALGIARGHNGAIKIYSELGVGTTFKVFLPASQQPAAAGRGDGPLVENWTGHSTILCIDDDETVRTLVEPVLSKYGYSVLLAEDGTQGLELFKANAERIGLVLLDLTMPDMDGAEVFTEIRTIRDGVPVLLMSGFNKQDATQRFVGKGLAGFLPKPFLVSDLLRMVREHVIELA